MTQMFPSNPLNFGQKLTCWMLLFQRFITPWSDGKWITRYISEKWKGKLLTPKTSPSLWYTKLDFVTWGGCKNDETRPRFVGFITELSPVAAAVAAAAPAQLSLARFLWLHCTHARPRVSNSSSSARLNKGRRENKHLFWIQLFS